MSHARRWTRACELLSALGVGIGMLEWTPVVAVAMVLLDTTVAAVALGLAASVRPGPRPPTRRQMATRALRVGAGLTALSALVAASGPVALLVVVLLVLTSPAVVRRIRPAATRPPPRPPRREPPVRPVPPARGTRADTGPDTGAASGSDAAAAERETVCLRNLDDAELCAQWRRTFWELALCRSVPEVLSSVRSRERCLEEMERRNPEAVRAWLASGTRASAGPEKFWAAAGGR